MANFEITTPLPPRFDGDFQMAPRSGYAVSAAEQGYLDAVNASLNQLAADEAGDIASRYPAPPLGNRQEARKAAAAALVADANKFTAGMNASGDTATVTGIGQRYTSGLPQFGAADPAAPRFEGDFEIVQVPAFNPGQDEQALFDSVKRALAEFVADKLKDATGGFTQYIVQARQEQRKSSADAIRVLVDEYWNGPRRPGEAAEQVMLLRGRYQVRRDRLTRLLFNVKLFPEKGKPVDGDEDRSLSIDLFGGLAPPQDMPSPEKQELYVQIFKTHTVISAVCDRMRDRSERGLRVWLWGAGEDSKRRARALNNEFLTKLHGIAKIGLELEFTQLAKLTLTELRNEFFIREAGRIKNMYVRRLGAWSAFTAATFMLCYVGYYTGYLTYQWGNEHKSFLLAACGAAIGTWASFSVRQVQFSFDDLVMVEESSLDPPMRILFVIVLTTAACLLFWNSAINLEIGGLKTEPNNFRDSGSVALLIGLFCGLSERALATAIAGRASAFVKGVSGS